MATYRAVLLTKKGGPEVLETVELEAREPGEHEARIRVLACGVGATDITMRRGYYPFAPKIPFVQGYDVVGTIDAVGAGVNNIAVGDKVCALTVHGGHAELLNREAADFVKVPPGLDDAEVVALILNYATAYQMIHRVARQEAGQTALVTGANGGVGQALLELLRVAGVTTYGAAGKRSHELVRKLGGIPIEGREAPADRSLRAVLPEGVDVAYDALGGRFTAQCIRATKKGGRVIGYGFSGAVSGTGNPSFLATGRGYFDLYVRTLVTGRKRSFYGITALYRKDKQPFHDDLPQLFELLAAGKIKPKISARLPLLDARKANEMMEAGGVDGKIVLVRD
jgi:NADPH:quinone reductase-like Zn-dependent oxidoreductase